MPLHAVSHNPQPMPQRIGALTNDQRWSHIVDSIAQLMADGDRMAHGLPALDFKRLPKFERDVYRQYAMAGVMPVAHPELVEDARTAAIHRACEAWSGDANDPIEVSPSLAQRMRFAWGRAFTFMDAAIDGVIHPREVARRASSLRLIAAPTVATKGRIQ